MKFKEIGLFEQFFIVSTIEAERGKEIIYIRVPNCIPASHYQEDMELAARETNNEKNRNYLNHQLSRVANAISMDGKKFVHIKDETEIRRE